MFNADRDQSSVTRSAVCICLATVDVCGSCKSSLGFLSNSTQAANVVARCMTKVRAFFLLLNHGPIINVCSNNASNYFAAWTCESEAGSSLVVASAKKSIIREGFGNDLGCTANLWTDTLITDQLLCQTIREVYRATNFSQCMILSETDIELPQRLTSSIHAMYLPSEEITPSFVTNLHEKDPVFLRKSEDYCRLASGISIQTEVDQRCHTRSYIHLCSLAASITEVPLELIFYMETSPEVDRRTHELVASMLALLLLLDYIELNLFISEGDSDFWEWFPGGEIGDCIERILQTKITQLQRYKTGNVSVAARKLVNEFQVIHTSEQGMVCSVRCHSVLDNFISELSVPMPADQRVRLLYIAHSSSLNKDERRRDQTISQRKAKATQLGTPMAYLSNYGYCYVNRALFMHYHHPPLIFHGPSATWTYSPSLATSQVKGVIARDYDYSRSRICRDTDGALPYHIVIWGINDASPSIDFHMINSAHLALNYVKSIENPARYALLFERSVVPSGSRMVNEYFEKEHGDILRVAAELNLTVIFKKDLTHPILGRRLLSIYSHLLDNHKIDVRQHLTVWYVMTIESLENMFKYSIQKGVDTDYVTAELKGLIQTKKFKCLVVPNRPQPHQIDSVVQQTEETNQPQRMGSQLNGMDERKRDITRIRLGYVLKRYLGSHVCGPTGEICPEFMEAFDVPRLGYMR